MPIVLTSSQKEKATYGACHLPLFQITPQNINLWSQITVITVSWNIFFTCFYIYLFCMCVEERFGGCTGKQMPQYSPEGQNTIHRSPLSSFSMWVSGIECRSSGCAESNPPLIPAFDYFLWSKIHCTYWEFFITVNKYKGIDSKVYLNAHYSIEDEVFKTLIAILKMLNINTY